MLAEIYIEALLADEEAADQVWEAWAWWPIAQNELEGPLSTPKRTLG